MKKGLMTLEFFKEVYLFNGFEEIEEASLNCVIINYNDDENKYFSSARFVNGKLKSRGCHGNNEIRKQQNEIYLKKLKQQVEIKKAKANERKKMQDKESSNIEVGQIYYSSWGYEQTNIDFYEIIEKKGLSVVIKQLESETVIQLDSMRAKVKPSLGKYKGEAIKKRIGAFGIKVEYSTLTLYDGKPKYESSYA